MLRTEPRFFGCDVIVGTGTVRVCMIFMHRLTESVVTLVFDYGSLSRIVCFQS